jgi:hypothetical protein
MHASTLMRRWLVNLVLAVIAGLLLLLAVSEHDRTQQQARLTPLAPEQIGRIELARDDEPEIVLERIDDIWWMRRPIAAPADAEHIGRLLPLADARSSRTLPIDAVDLEQTGLARPRLRLKLDGLELRFGATEPIGEQRYVQVGDLAHLIDDRFLPYLSAQAPSLLSRRLLPPGFNPANGSIDGRPLGPDVVAALIGIEAERVEPLAGELSGQLLQIESADGTSALRFLVAEGGTRWSRLDQRLSWLFTTPPLVEADEDAGLDLPEGPPLQADPGASPGSQALDRNPGGD